MVGVRARVRLRFRFRFRFRHRNGLQTVQELHLQLQEHSGWKRFAKAILTSSQNGCSYTSFTGKPILVVLG